MERVDGVGNAWYNTPADDLYLHNFVFFTRMQTTRHMMDRYRHFPKRDKVLDRLMEEGTFDCRDPDYPNTAGTICYGLLSVNGAEVAR